MWPSEDPICELASLVKLYRRCRWSFFFNCACHNHLVFIDQQARPAKSQILSVLWSTGDIMTPTKRETSGVTPQHHSTSLPLFPRFAEFPFCFFCLFKFHLRKSPTECVLRDGHETLTLRYGPIPCPFATQAMLGIYWRLLSMKRDVGSAHQDFADQLLQLIEMNPAVWRHDLRSSWDEFRNFLGSLVWLLSSHHVIVNFMNVVFCFVDSAAECSSGLVGSYCTAVSRTHISKPPAGLGDWENFQNCTALWWILAPAASHVRGRV